MKARISFIWNVEEKKILIVFSQQNIWGGKSEKTTEKN